MSARAKSPPPRERSELAGCDEVAAAERPTDPSEASGPKADTRTADQAASQLRSGRRTRAKRAVQRPTRVRRIKPRRSCGAADGPERSELADHRAMSARAKSPPPRERSELAGCDAMSARAKSPP